MGEFSDNHFNVLEFMIIFIEVFNTATLVFNNI